MMNDRLFLTEDPNTQLAIELARLRERVAALEAIEQPIRDTGLWTPSITGSSSAGTITQSAQAGRWYRVGSILHVTGRVMVSAISVVPGGSLEISGLPLPGVAVSGDIAGGVNFIYWSANVANGFTQVAGIVDGGGSRIRVIRSGDNVAPTGVLGSELITGEWRFNGFYWVA